MKILRAPYRTGQPTDDLLPRLISKAKENITKGEDDRLFLVVGPTGVGKSTLIQHIITYYNSKPDVKNIVLRKEDFARQQYLVNKRSVEGEKDLFLALDEANVGRRDAMSAWVKDVITIYMTNRVFGILHLWAWPSAQLIDKLFIQERVAGLFFCYTKENDKPRQYVFFKKNNLLRMLDDGLDLNTFSLRKHRKKYGTYCGCYNRYEGPLLEAYKEVKLESALKISEEFMSKWAEEDDAVHEEVKPTEKTYKFNDLLGIFNCSKDKLRKIISKAKYDNPSLESRFKKGRWYLKEDDLTIIRGYV